MTLSRTFFTPSSVRWLSASLSPSSSKRRLLSLLWYFLRMRVGLLLAELGARVVGQLGRADDPVEVDRPAVVALGRVDAVLSVEELDDVPVRGP